MGHVYVVMRQAQHGKPKRKYSMPWPLIASSRSSTDAGLYPRHLEPVVNMGFLDKMRGDAPKSVIDPVCGMKIDPAKAAGKSQHAGETYHFCSAGCNQKFDADPHTFLGSHAH